MTHTYYAETYRDNEAGVWYVSDTDVPGLVAEAVSERDLFMKIREFVPKLCEMNRYLFDQSSLETIPLRITSRRLETIRLAD